MIKYLFKKPKRFELHHNSREEDSFSILSPDHAVFILVRSERIRCICSIESYASQNSPEPFFLSL